MKTKTTLLAAGILLATITTGLSQANFIKITNSPLVNLTADFTSCAWGDYDNDGLIDLFVGNYTGNNFLFHNNGNGNFTRITNGPVVTNGGQSYCSTWGDFNNDGFLDLFVNNGYGDGGYGFLYRNNGDGTFTKITTAPVATQFGNFAGCAWADFDNDGFLDLFSANTPGSNFLFRNQSDGTFQRVLASSLVQPAGNSLGVGWADYNNDGRPDLYVARGYSSPQQNLLYRNDGNGTFTRITNGSPVTDIGSSVGVAWGDYDNDGFPDLFVSHDDGTGSSLEKNCLYHNNGDGTFTKVTAGSIANDIGVSVGCAWGDYDNDGYLDLFVGNRNGHQNFLYHNNKDGTFTRIATGPIAQDAGQNGGCAWGDYDNDGFLDLFVSNLGPNTGGFVGRNFLYHNTGNSNSWLEVRCVGTAANRSAFGAKVRVQATIGGRTLWQLREINPGDGYSGNSLIAHFGLGDATNIDTVRIEWPSGIVQTMTNVAPTQFLTVVEHQQPGAALPITFTNVSRLASGAVDLSATGDSGLLYLFEASTNLVNWTKLGVRSNATGSIQFTDTGATNYANRFYRASVP